MKLVALGATAVGLLLIASAALAAGAPINRAERAEVRFLEGMMDHHQMAVDMANDCLKKATDQTLLTLCQNIIVAQSAEIKQMELWLKDWYGVDYAPVAMMPAAESSAGMLGLHGNDATAEPMAGMDMSGMNMGSASSDPTMMMGMMAGLNSLSGHDYEVAWVEAMIDHHDDALHMADRLLKQVEHPELRDMATTIIKDQSGEIHMMETLLDQWAQK